MSNTYDGREACSEANGAKYEANRTPRSGGKNQEEHQHTRAPARGLLHGGGGGARSRREGEGVISIQSRSTRVNAISRFYISGQYEK